MPRCGAVADHPVEDARGESDPLGPTRAALGSERVLPLALAATSDWLGRLLMDLPGKGCGRDLLDRESALVVEG